VFEDDTLVSWSEYVYSAKDGAISLQVPLGSSLLGPVDVHVGVHPHESEKHHFTQFWTVKCFLGVQVQRSPEVFSELLSSQLFMKNS